MLSNYHPDSLKVDLLSQSSRQQLDHFLEPDTEVLANTGLASLGGRSDLKLFESLKSCAGGDPCCNPRWGEKHARLSAALGRLLDDYSLVKFFPLDITNEENVVDLLTVVGGVPPTYP